MTTLFLDIETTGIPPTSYGKFPKYTDLSKYEKARAVQISWIVVKNDHIIADSNFIIKPNFEITNSWVHDITQERAEKEGTDIRTVLEYFAEDCAEALRIICHNVDFDLNIIRSEFHRADMSVDEIDALHTICTMKRFCKPNQKWPKLGSLYFECFDDVFPEHNALEDAYACLRCYYLLAEKKDMKDEIEQARKELQ